MEIRANDEDYDHEVEANLTDEERNEFALISEVALSVDSHQIQFSRSSKVAQLIRVLFGLMKLDFLPFFNSVLEQFVVMLV